MYIDKDKSGNIVALYGAKQREGQEFLEGAELHEIDLQKINKLEASITPRRLREAALSQAGADWLADIDAQIVVLRG